MLFRFMEYIGLMGTHTPSKCAGTMRLCLPHSHCLTITKVVLSPVPLSNQSQTGCTPYCSVLVGGKPIFMPKDFTSLK